MPEDGEEPEGGILLRRPRSRRSEFADSPVCASSGALCDGARETRRPPPRFAAAALALHLPGIRGEKSQIRPVRPITPPSGLVKRIISIS